MNFPPFVPRRRWRPWLGAVAVWVLAGHTPGSSAWAASGVSGSSDPSSVSSDEERRQEISVVDFEWKDTARLRDVPARLYWPQPHAEIQPGNQRVPLVVFSHGLGGSRMGYSHIGRYWASKGFASLHLQHLGSDRSVWTSGFFSLISNLQAAASDTNAIARAFDVSFGITTLLADERFSRFIDPQRIAVAGHSYGANTALLVAGATVQREVSGAWKSVSYRDPRVSAAVLMSAPPFYREGDLRSILKNIAIPTLHITGTEDVIRIPGYRSEVADRIAVFDATPSGPNAPYKALAVFTGATHSIFTDRIDAAGPDLNRVVKAATRELSVEFLNATLRGRPFERVSHWLQRRGDVVSQQAVLP